MASEERLDDTFFCAHCGAYWECDCGPYSRRDEALRGGIFVSDDDTGIKHGYSVFRPPSDPVPQNHFFGVHQFPSHPYSAWVPAPPFDDLTYQINKLAAELSKQVMYSFEELRQAIYSLIDPDCDMQEILANLEEIAKTILETLKTPGLDIQAVCYIWRLKHETRKDFINKTTIDVTLIRSPPQ